MKNTQKDIGVFFLHMTDIPYKDLNNQLDILGC